MNKRDCSICDEMLARETSRFARAINKHNVFNAILFETDQLAVIPSIGPLTKGHCLVVTKRHVNNVLVTALFNGFFHEVKECIDAVLSEFGRGASVVLGEHGLTESKESHSLCSTEHAHLHVIPIAQSMVVKIVTTFGTSTIPSTLFQVGKHISVYKEYVVLAGSVYYPDYYYNIIHGDQIPSQVLRKHVGEILGKKDWDWKSNVNNKDMQEMIESSFAINKVIY